MLSLPKLSQWILVRKRHRGLTAPNVYSDVRAWAQSPKLAQAGPQKPSQALAVTRLWRAYGLGFSL